MDDLRRPRRRALRPRARPRARGASPRTRCGRAGRCRRASVRCPPPGEVHSSATSSRAITRTRRWLPSSTSSARPTSSACARRTRVASVGLTRFCSTWMSMLRLTPARLASSSSVSPRSARKRRRLRASASAVSSGLATPRLHLCFGLDGRIALRPRVRLLSYPCTVQDDTLHRRREMAIAGELTQEQTELLFAHMPIGLGFSVADEEDVVRLLGRRGLLYLQSEADRPDPLRLSPQARPRRDRVAARRPESRARRTKSTRSSAARTAPSASSTRRCATATAPTAESSRPWCRSTKRGLRVTSRRSPRHRAASAAQGCPSWP